MRQFCVARKTFFIPVTRTILKVNWVLTEKRLNYLRLAKVQFGNWSNRLTHLNRELSRFFANAVRSCFVSCQYLAPSTVICCYRSCEDTVLFAQDLRGCTLTNQLAFFFLAGSDCIHSYSFGSFTALSLTTLHVSGCKIAEIFLILSPEELFHRNRNPNSPCWRTTGLGQFFMWKVHCRLVLWQVTLFFLNILTSFSNRSRQRQAREGYNTLIPRSFDWWTRNTRISASKICEMKNINYLMGHAIIDKSAINARGQ